MFSLELTDAHLLHCIMPYLSAKRNDGSSGGGIDSVCNCVSPAITLRCWQYSVPGTLITRHAKFVR